MSIILHCLQIAVILDIWTSFIDVIGCNTFWSLSTCRQSKSILFVAHSVKITFFFFSSGKSSKKEWNSYMIYSVEPMAVHWITALNIAKSSSLCKCCELSSVWDALQVELLWAAHCLLHRLPFCSSSESCNCLSQNFTGKVTVLFQAVERSRLSAAGRCGLSVCA